MYQWANEVHKVNDNLIFWFGYCVRDVMVEFQTFVTREAIAQMVPT